MLITSAGDHLLRSVVGEYPLTINVQGNFQGREVYLMYLEGGELKYLLNGSIEPYKQYVMAQRLNLPLYLRSPANLYLSVTIGEYKDYSGLGYTGQEVSLPV